MKDRSHEMLMNIPSDFKYLGAVDAAIQDLAKEFAFSEDSINDMSTALIEACSNAIEHGNKFASEKRVKVFLVFNGSSVTARICDEGGGFDYQNLLSRPEPPDAMSERGRRLIIMKAFTDDLKFSYSKGDGLCVEMTKTREGAAPDENRPD